MGSLPGQIVVPYPPVCPSTAVEVKIFADNPLEISNSNSPHTVEHLIPNGKTFRLQRVIMGAENDPSEKGCMVEIFYKDSSEHLVSRYFTEPTTEIMYADVGSARDGTAMVGDGSTKKILVRRTRLSSSKQRVDVFVQGFEE
jgi:hypothetical protein